MAGFQFCLEFIARRLLFLLDELVLIDELPRIQQQLHEHCLPDFGGHEHLF